MQHSFVKVIELMENSSLLDDESRSEEKCIAALRTGLNIDANFWEGFLRLCNNSDTLSELLDIPKDRISKWSQRIRKYLELTET
jgi:hypothetical protein